MLRNRFYIFAAALLLWFSGMQAFSAGTNATALSDLNDLIERINDKVKQDKATAADLSDNLKEFDALLAKYQDQKAEDRAQILVMKAQVYIQVLGDIDSAVAAFKQFKRDFPNFAINGHRVDDIINELTAMQRIVALRKIESALTVGTQFPNFEVKDTTGKTISIGQNKGKVVLVDFWATTCPVCLVEMPHLAAVYEKFHGRGFEIIGISTDADRAAMDRYLGDKKLPWRQIHDGDNVLALKYGITLLPTSYLLDRDGKILGRSLRGPDLEEAVAKAVGAK